MLLVAPSLNRFPEQQLHHRQHEHGKNSVGSDAEDDDGGERSLNFRVDPGDCAGEFEPGQARNAKRD